MGAGAGAIALQGRLYLTVFSILGCSEPICDDEHFPATTTSLHSILSDQSSSIELQVSYSLSLLPTRRSKYSPVTTLPTTSLDAPASPTSTAARASIWSLPPSSCRIAIPTRIYDGIPHLQTPIQKLDRNISPATMTKARSSLFPRARHVRGKKVPGGSAGVNDIVHRQLPSNSGVNLTGISDMSVCIRSHTSYGRSEVWLGDFCSWLGAMVLFNRPQCPRRDTRKQSE
jgi:hypothetical protein